MNFRPSLGLLMALVLSSFVHRAVAQKLEEKTWPDGSPKSREALDKKGFKTGECIYWYENGQMRLKEFYEKGRRSGKSQGWFEDGTQEFDRTYVVMQRNNGTLAGTEPIAVKDGLWTEFHENGQKKKEEHFALGILQGAVRTWYDNGQLEELKTMADKFENGTYERYFESGKPNIKGQYINGEKTGEWQTWYENGELAYRETFESDKHIDGPWRGAHPNGADSLSGSYIHGRKEGIWVALHPNGNMKSKTLYRFGMPSGQFVEFFANGNKSREGAFGESTADVKRGREEGEWKEWYENGQMLRTASYDDGQLKGPCTEWYANGQKKFETNYVLGTFLNSRRDDMMDGMTREWHENGQLMTEGAYVNGMRDGLWKEWYDNGNLRMEAVFDRTKVNGAITEYYPDGKTESSGFYKVAGRKKERTGHWTTWYENGERQSDGEYIDNKRVGRWQQWYPTGTLKEDAFFDKGMYQGAFKDYHENGQLRSEGHYKGTSKLKVRGSHSIFFLLPIGFDVQNEGVMNGVWKFYDEQGKLLRTEAWYNGRKR